MQSKLSNVSWEWRLKNIDEVPRRRVEIEGDKVVSEWMVDYTETGSKINCPLCDSRKAMDELAAERYA